MSGRPGPEAAAEAAARASYGRLLALLVARTRDIAAAEDALADAFVAALRTWPERGVPDNPDAWLMTVARHGLSNAARHGAVAAAAAADLAVLADEVAPDPGALPDRRLELLFVCAHPAIDPRVRTPLMLQAVLGLDAAQIAAAFLVAPATMGQRLVRAKAKIRDAGLRFELPGRDDMPERLADVLDAVYAAYGTAWDVVSGADGGPGELAEEAIYLGRLIVALLPAEPEPKGLLALMLYCEARRRARRGADGRFVPLAEQDPRLWSRERIIEAEDLLTRASRAGVFGRYQCEAAIQSVHVQRPLAGRDGRPAHHGHEAHEAHRARTAALITLYGLLAARCPSVGAAVGQAAALLEAGRAAEARAALDALDALDGADPSRYQPYWVVRARTLAALGEAPAAAAALDTAIGLTQDPAIRDFLRRPG